MRYLISAMLIVVGVIHLVPITGVLGAQQLTELYGMDFSEPNLEILMRHRAVLFGLLGGLLVLAAFRASLQLLAFTAGFISVLSFLWLSLSVGSPNDELARVFSADLIALLCLTVGFAGYCFQRAAIAKLPADSPDKL